MLQFHIIKSTSKYNFILGRTTLQKFNMKVGTIKLVVEFQTWAGVTTIKSDYPGREVSFPAAMEESNTREITRDPTLRDTPKD
uniref:Protein kinase, ATP binding site-containing protein n=1 Tax=Tanacetum cinerariifolium TaxID=118510 RepID=A0A699QXQ3_TANCI|nr:protein kinase, ATP binding site-containing protein [Tanacetum cinerariifolium]